MPAPPPAPEPEPIPEAHALPPPPIGANYRNSLRNAVGGESQVSLVDSATNVSAIGAGGSKARRPGFTFSGQSLAPGITDEMYLELYAKDKAYAAGQRRRRPISEQEQAEARAKQNILAAFGRGN